jgi:hypothetical protein
MHDSKFWMECRLLAPIVGFSHSEKTLFPMFSTQTVTLKVIIRYNTG